MKKILISAIALLLCASPVLAGEISRSNIQSGQALTLSTASVDAGSDTFVNDDRTFFVVSNGNDTSCTVTITAQRSQLKTRGFGVIDLADKVFDVASGDSIVAIPAGTYNNDEGRVEVSYAGDTSAVSVGVFRRRRD